MRHGVDQVAVRSPGPASANAASRAPAAPRRRARRPRSVATAPRCRPAASGPKKPVSEAKLSGARAERVQGDGASQERFACPRVGREGREQPADFGVRPQFVGRRSGDPSRPGEHEAADEVGRVTARRSAMAAPMEMPPKTTALDAARLDQRPRRRRRRWRWRSPTGRRRPSGRGRGIRASAGGRSGPYGKTSAVWRASPHRPCWNSTGVPGPPPSSTRSAARRGPGARWPVTCAHATPASAQDVRAGRPPWRRLRGREPVRHQRPVEAGRASGRPRSAEVDRRRGPPWRTRRPACGPWHAP